MSSLISCHSGYFYLAPASCPPCSSCWWDLASPRKPLLTCPVTSAQAGLGPTRRSGVACLHACHLLCSLSCDEIYIYKIFYHLNHFEVSSSVVLSTFPLLCSIRLQNFLIIPNRNCPLNPISPLPALGNLNSTFRVQELDSSGSLT